MEKCCVGKKSDRELRRAVDFLKLIAEENRLKIVCLLAHGELCVCEIWGALNIPQNLTSHHLKALKDYGLIDSRKKGLNVFYSLNIGLVQSSKGLLEKFLTIQKKPAVDQFCKSKDLL